MNKRVYELSISSNYVHTWGVEEAVREIMQNAIDSAANGNKLYVSYSNGVLTIKNIGGNLDISDLVLGQTSKDDPTKYIGTYGEGFKLALIVLLRNDINVVISTNEQRWIPEFRKSVKFKIDTLHVDVVQTTGPKYEVEFELFGIDIDMFEQIRANSLAMSKAMGFSIGEVIPTPYGDILLESRYKGKMFVNGLYVQTDASFQYGYDFKPEFLHLDRDRKAINYYKMRELTAKAVTSQSNVQLVHSAITKYYTDVRDVIEYMDSISQEFKVNFAQEFIKSHELDEDTFVGMEKEVKVSGKLRTFRTDSRAIAQLVNAGQGRTVEYESIKLKVHQLSKQEEAETSYKGSDFERLVDYLWEHKDKFDVDDLVEELKSLGDLHTSHFDLIEDKVFSLFYDENIEDIVDAIEHSEIEDEMDEEE